MKKKILNGQIVLKGGFVDVVSCQASDLQYVSRGVAPQILMESHSSIKKKLKK